MSGSIHRMVIVGALYFIFRLCSYKDINNVSPEYLKARGLRQRIRSIWELFLCKVGNRQGRPSLLVAGGKNQWEGKAIKRRKKSLTPARTLHFIKPFPRRGWQSILQEFWTMSFILHKGKWGPSSGRGCFQGPTGILELRREPCFQFSPSRHMGNSHSYPFRRCDPWLILDHTTWAKGRISPLVELGQPEYNSRLSLCCDQTNIPDGGHRATCEWEDMKQSSSLTLMGTKKVRKNTWPFLTPMTLVLTVSYCSTTEPMLTLNSYAKLFPPLSKARNWAQVSHI